LVFLCAAPAPSPTYTPSLHDALPISRSDSSAIDAFVQQARALAPHSAGEGRLILALDATMSRQPTWDMACEIQSRMFDAVGKARSEEHTSELQSRENLVCRLLLEKKK